MMTAQAAILKSTETALTADYAVAATFQANVFEVRERNGSVRIVEVRIFSGTCSCRTRSGQACDQWALRGTCRHVGSVLRHIAKTIGLPVMPVPATRPLPQPTARVRSWYGVGRYSAGRPMGAY